MENRLLAVCVMTYEHPQTVAKILRYFYILAEKFEFDIYYFDSSHHNETEEIVNDYKQKSKHIFYRRIPEEMNPDYKFLIPFDKVNFPYKYKYLWPVKDRIAPDMELMTNIYEKLKMGADILALSYIYLNDIFSEKTIPESITKEEFYRDYAWLATDLYTIIYSYDTILSNFRENEITERYFFGNDMQKKCYFPHTALLFHYLAKLKNPRIEIINMGRKRNHILSDDIKGGWQDSNAGIEIFGLYWPRLNYALPSIYDQYKRYAIRKETNHVLLFGSIDGLISLHFYEQDSLEISKQMLQNWDDYSDISAETAEDISRGDFTSAYNEFQEKFYSCVCNSQLKNLAVLCHFNSWIKAFTPFCNDKKIAEVFDQADKYFINSFNEAD